jgi:outer membrane protein assembly factor BamA
MAAEPGEIAALPDRDASLALHVAAARADSVPAGGPEEDLGRLAAAAGALAHLGGTAASNAAQIRDYKPHLAPDLSSVGGMVGYDTGFAGQSQLQLSDLLGDYTVTLGLGIYGSLKESDLYLSFLNRTGRINWSVAAFQFRRRYGALGALAMGDASRQTYRGVQVGAIRPFDMFSRLEASLRFAGVQGRYFLGETSAEVAADRSVESMRTFVGPALAYVSDSALYGYAGPMKGRRLRVALEGGVGELNYATLETDLRQYWNINRWYTVAGRIYGATSYGSSPQTVYLGGAQSLRGWDYGSLLGHHALLASTEFRFPLVRHLALGWPLPLELGFIEGVLFADGASAWDGRWFRSSRAIAGGVAGRAPLLAAGGGMRVNLGAFVLKLDWARLHDTGTGRRGNGSSVALGTDF